MSITITGDNTMHSTVALRVRDSVKLSDQVDCILRRLEAYDLSLVSRRLLGERALEANVVAEAIVEFKRFMALVAFGVSPIAVIGPVIDEVWHQFLLFTPQYSCFCEEVFGKFIHHQPNTPETPVSTAALGNFIESYRMYFGDVPQIWFEKMDAETLMYFQNGGRSSATPAKWSGWIADQIEPC